MSTNVTLKRKGASGNPVELYPKTTTAQVSGLITNGKISIGLLPDTVFGGMKLVGSFSTTTGATGPLALQTFITGTTTTGYSISANLDSFTGLSHAAGNYTGIGRSFVGHYWVATNSVSIQDEVLEGSFQPSVVFDDGVAPVSGAITVEAGDWLLISFYDEVSTQFTISIINNTYADAGTSAKGVVNLSNITTVTGSTTGNQVITQGVLGGLIGTAAGDIAAGDHTHSTLYQPLDADLTALAALTGTGFVKRTGDTTYALDSNTYLNASTSSTQDAYFGDIHLRDDGTPSHYLKITASSNLTANRTLSFATGDSNRTITLAGDLTTAGAISFPTIASNQILIGNGAGTLGTTNSTAIGRNTLTIPDIGAISFARYNADETISMLNAENFRTAIGAGTSSTSGTVTSVAVDGDILLSSVASNGAITSTGTISHATAAGFKHIPSGGGEAQVLAYGDASGVARWEGRATGWTRVFYVNDATAAITNVTATEGDIFIEF
jgi:hypothetical protein